MKPYSFLLKRNPFKGLPFADVLKYDPAQPRDDHGRWSRSDGGASLGDANAKAHALFSSAAMHLPKQAQQPVHTEREIFQRGEEAVTYLKQWLNQGKGVASQMGYQTYKGSVGDAIKDGTMSKPGGLLFVAPVKGRERAEEKVRLDYKGNWAKLLDVARASIAVDTLDEARKVIDKLSASGMQLAKRPKNRFDNPTEEGYRDTLLNVKTDKGTIVELQVHVKPMLIAKEDGHVTYKTIRSLLGKYGEKSDRATWSAADNKAYDDAEAESRRIYDAAWKKVI